MALPRTKRVRWGLRRCRPRVRRRRPSSKHAPLHRQSRRDPGVEDVDFNAFQLALGIFYWTVIPRSAQGRCCPGSIAGFLAGIDGPALVDMLHKVVSPWSTWAMMAMFRMPFMGSEGKGFRGAKNVQTFAEYYKSCAGFLRSACPDGGTGRRYDSNSKFYLSVGSIPTRIQIERTPPSWRRFGLVLSHQTPHNSDSMKRVFGLSFHRLHSFPQLSCNRCARSCETFVQKVAPGFAEITNDMVFVNHTI